MPITIDWTTTDQNAIHWQFEQTWTWDDFDTAKQQCLTMVNHAGKPVDIILDFDRSKYLPPHTLIHFGTTLRQITPPNLNQIQVVGADDVMRKVCAIMRRLYPDQMARVFEATALDSTKSAKIQ